MNQVIRKFKRFFLKQNGFESGSIPKKIKNYFVAFILNSIISNKKKLNIGKVTYFLLDNYENIKYIYTV